MIYALFYSVGVNNELYKMCLPVKVWLFPFNVHGIDGIQPEPGRKSEAALMRPSRQRG